MIMVMSQSADLAEDGKVLENIQESKVLDCMLLKTFKNGQQNLQYGTICCSHHQYVFISYRVMGNRLPFLHWICAHMHKR